MERNLPKGTLKLPLSYLGIPGGIKFDLTEERMYLSEQAQALMHTYPEAGFITFAEFGASLINSDRVKFDELIQNLKSAAFPLTTDLSLSVDDNNEVTVRFFCDETQWLGANHVSAIVSEIKNFPVLVGGNSLLQQNSTLASGRAARAYLNDVIEELIHTFSVDQMADKICRRASRFFGITRCLLKEITPDLSFTVSGTQAAEENPIAGTHSLHDLLKPGLIKCLEQGHTVVVNDVIADPLTNTKNLEAAGIQSFVNIPFLKQGKIKLIFGAIMNQPRRWTSEEIGLLEDTARCIWLRYEFLKNQEVLKQLENKDTELLAVQSLSEELERSRKAAFNLLEDTVLAKAALLRSEAKLQNLNASLEEEVNIRSPELKANRDLLKSIIEASFSAVALLEPVAGDVLDFRIILANVKTEEIIGISGIQGKLCRTIFNGYRQDYLYGLMEKTLISGEPQTTEYEFYHPDGVKWFNTIFTRVGNRVLATTMDITEKKKHADEILKSLSILQQAEEVADMGSWEYEISSGRFTISDGMMKIFQVNADEDVKPDRYIELATDDSVEAAMRTVQKITRAHEGFEEIVHLRHPEGTRIIKIKATVIKDQKDVSSKIVGVDVDITNQVRSSDIIGMMTESIFELDRDWKITFINQAALKFWGQERSEMEGKRFWTLFPELLGTPIHRHLTDLMTSRKPIRRQFFLERIRRWIYASVSPSPGGLAILFTDIQEQKDAMEKIRENEQRLRTIFENTPDIISRHDTNCRLIFGNQSYARVLPVPYEQALGKQMSEIGLPAEVADAFSHKMEVVIHTGKPMEHYCYLTSPKGEHYFYTRLVAEFDSDGAVQSVLAIGRDIIELKKVQEELIQKNKRLTETQQTLETKDNFIRIASHELKTPITSLKGYAQMLLETCQENERDEFLVKGLTVINKQVTKLTKLINDLLDITRMDTGTMKIETHDFDLCEMIKESIEFIKPTTTHKINFQGLNCLPVSGDKDKINQVFMNLLTNAIKYSPKDGSISISVVADDQEVTVTVTDEGIGIPGELLEKIFERFYRVHGNNQNTFSGFGIGLYIAMEIIRLHGGKIWADSKVNEGSSFHFTLPLANGAVSESL